MRVSRGYRYLSPGCAFVTPPFYAKRPQGAPQNGRPTPIACPQTGAGLGSGRAEAEAEAEVVLGTKAESGSPSFHSALRDCVPGGPSVGGSRGHGPCGGGGHRIPP